MRLLQVDENGEFRLTDDQIDNIPPYAILSHTWGEDHDEVNFKDLTVGPRMTKAGYKKLRFCAGQATRDGLQFFWVDTCCIDKSNNVELTEAINSMFRWYRNSAKCYVYLADVSTTQWELTFRKSRWFVRGWTLQELIAPPSVEFFSVEGQRLGDRDSMDRRISEITGIDIDAFRGKPLSHFSVDERMSWAKNRMTTREEDAAYSLLGIFEIFMPLIYGEGRHSALDRLQKEVNSEPKLPIASGSSFDSYLEERNATCLENTRVELQKDIMAWVDDKQGEQVFWLNGMAGTGKSTISRTVARSLARRGQLGASFFFKKGEGERGGVARFFTTIAADLARQVPGVRYGVKKALEADPNITSRALKDQFEKLVLQPLSESEQHLRVSVLVVVIDALDECDEDQDVQTIVQLLSQTKDFRSVSLRVLVTSRPEQSIRLAFRQLLSSTYRELTLHEVAEATVEHDLSIFFRHELEKVREERRLGADWPGGEKILQLAQMATPLFIFAATACRFISDGRGNPARRLETILQSRTAGLTSKLDKTYLPVLGQLFEDEDEDEKEELAREFREVVGPIVVLESPLSSTSLAKLLDIAREDVNSRLYSLHSVLNIPRNDDVPIRLLHKSFQDFVLDPKKRDKSPFWVDGRQTHEHLAAKCLELMSGSLKKDICGFKSPGTSRNEIDIQVLDRCLPSEVRYACIYWVHHAAQSQVCIQDNDRTHSFLQKYFLYWLEALGLMEKVSTGFNMVISLSHLLQSDESKELSGFLYDAKRLIMQNWSIIEEAPLQLYASAITFAPEKSIIRKIFKDDHVPKWITKLPEVPDDWTAALRVLEGHSSATGAVAFSPDGKLIASASCDSSVRLWDATTGECRSTLKGHSGYAVAVAFSSNSKLVASGSSDNTVRLWNATTGVCHKTFEGHSQGVWAIAFSPNGKLVASASQDGTVRLWDVADGVCSGILEGHSAYVSDVAFSPDSKLVASASFDFSVRLWDTTTRVCRNVLDGHSSILYAVAFSSDCKQVASASRDGTVRIWDVATCVCTSLLEGHSYDVRAVVFSSNSKMIASASEDETVRLWDAATGACLHILRGHTGNIYAVAISPDNKLIASGSHDTTVRIWDAATGACRDILKGHVQTVIAVAFSPDSRLVVSSSEGRTVRLWDVTREGFSGMPKGHSRAVTVMASSPDGKLVVSASEDNTMRFWDATTTMYSEVGFKSYDVIFSPNGRLVASVDMDHVIRLWDTTIWSCCSTLDGRFVRTNRVFSPDSKLIATTNFHNEVQLWDVSTGTCLGAHEIGRMNDRPMVFSPDSKFIALAPQNQRVDIMVVATGASHCTLGQMSYNAKSVSFSPDGELIASPAMDYAVVLWDVATGTCRSKLLGHSTRISAMAFSSDGKLVAAAAEDTIRIWDVNTKACRTAIPVDTPLSLLSFSADGSCLATRIGQISISLSHEASLQEKSPSRFFIRGNWITNGIEDILWLPPDFRPNRITGRCIAINKCSIVLGSGSGVVTFMSMSTNPDYSIS